MLLGYGADATKMEQFRKTPLHAACTRGHRACVTLLIEHACAVGSPVDDVQAFLFAADADGHSPLEAASTNGHLDDEMLALFPWYRRWWQRCCAPPSE